MAPTLRSATNTPTKKPTPIETTPASTPTKRCKICKKPRLGHPRSGCPFGSPEDEHESPDAVSEALESMNLASSLENQLELEDTKAAIRSRRRVSGAQALVIPSSESLASLSTASSQIVGDLIKPGIFDDDTEDAEGKVMRWQIDNYTPKRPTRKEKQMLMPCTFVTPSPETSFASIISAPPPPVSQFNSVHTIRQEAPCASRTTVTRTMSVEEQAIFIDGLRQMSKATAYHLPVADISSLQANAMKIGLHSHLVQIDDFHKTDETEGLLVIGRDGKAVQALVEKLEADAKQHIGNGGRASGFRAAAGGVVVGAAATFAGLAFA